MKRIFYLLTSILIPTILIAGELKYDDIKPFFLCLKTHTIKGEACVSLYIKPKKKNVDYSKANFRMVSPKGEIVVLEQSLLKSIPIKKLSHEDINYIKDGYEVRLWIPTNHKKYKGWVLKNDFEEGVISAVFSRIVSSEPIEEKRKKYKKEAEQVVAPDA